MPQMVVEYSSNVVEKNQLTDLLKRCHVMLSESLPTELMTCKSRAVERDVYCVGDGAKHNAFVHVNLKVMPGRNLEVLNAIGQKLLEILKGHYAESTRTLNLQITLEIEELQKTYFKFAAAPANQGSTAN